MRRTAREIINDIIKILKNETISLRMLEKKVNADNRMIAKYTGILSDLQLIRIEKQGERQVPYARLSKAGRRIL